MLNLPHKKVDKLKSDYSDSFVLKSSEGFKKNSRRNKTGYFSTFSKAFNGRTNGWLGSLVALGVGFVTLLSIVIGGFIFYQNFLEDQKNAEASGVTISSITPNTGSVDGGESVTIDGSGFEEFYDPDVYSTFASGNNHTVAIKNDGTVWSWGANWYGQLGNNTTTRSTIPVQVSNLTNVSDIAAGNYHVLALRNDNTVWSWGNGGQYELGDGTNTNIKIPKEDSNL